MNIENRNKFVTETNVNSVEFEKVLSLIDRSLPNIVETERSKVFEIANLCDQNGIDFWKDNCIFRNIVVYDLNNVTVNALQEFEEYSKFDFHLPFLKDKNVFLKRKIEQYTMFNEYLKNYDIKEKFYELSCTYLQMLYPTPDMKNMFLHMYGELYHTGKKISALETDRYNKVVLFSTVYQKEKDVNILMKQALGELTENDKIEILDAEIRNKMQFLEIVDTRAYEKTKKEYQKLSKVRK